MIIISMAWLSDIISMAWLSELTELCDISHARILRVVGGGGGGGGGGQGVRKNHKNIGFLSNTGPDPLKITKLSSQHSMLGHHRPSSKTTFKWNFAGGPMMGRL